MEHLTIHTNKNESYINLTFKLYQNGHIIIYLFQESICFPCGTVPLEDKQTTQCVFHAEPMRWRFELNTFVFACPRIRKRVSEAH